MDFAHGCTNTACRAPERAAGLGAGARAWAGAWCSPARYIVRLGGGSVNEVFRVDSAGGRFVLRLDGAAWRRPGVDRARELTLHGAAATAGVAPAIVAAEPERDRPADHANSSRAGSVDEADYADVACAAAAGRAAAGAACAAATRDGGLRSMVGGAGLPAADRRRAGSAQAADR